MPARWVILPLAGILLAPQTGTAQTPVHADAPYRDAGLSTDARVRDLVGRMTLEEKFWQLFMIPGSLDDASHDYANGVFGLQISTTGEAAHAASDTAQTAAGAIARAHTERINAIQRFFIEDTRLGIPIIAFDEAVHGLMRAGATMFPQAIAQAATWDTVLVGRVATAIARETRSRGVRQVLSPVVNIADDVRWGRVEETYGEDPYLASVIGRAFIRPFEHAGVVTTPKHFVANVGAGGRDSYPIDHSRRLLEELFFPPFRSAIHDAGARSIMTSYNSVDGLPATQNRWLLRDVLKDEWRFDGFVISDQSATGGATVLHMTEPNTPTAAKHALEAGLDVVFQSSYGQQRPYWEAFRTGMIADSVIDEAVARVLRVKFDLGLFERPYMDADSAAYWNGHTAHRTLARDAARAGIVLLKNDSGILPISATSAAVAVIGVDAVEARLGGYSGPGIRPIPALDAMRERLSPARVHHAPGPGRTTREHVVIPSENLSTVLDGDSVRGLRGEYFGDPRLTGEPLVVRADPQIDFSWTFNRPAPGLATDWYSVRWTGSVSVPAAGVRRIGVEGNDGYRLWVDGELLIDNWTKRSRRTLLADVALEPGQTYDVRLEYFESTGNARVTLVWDADVNDDWRARIDEAVDAARRSDMAVVFAGTEEGEFRDRAFLSLPGHQEELILAVAATGRPTIVVLVSGGAVTMSRWLDQVDGVMHAWFPGEEGGNAVADVLLGEYDPAGRLPVTFPIAEGQLPLTYNHKPTGRGDDYVDLTGQPLFPFGYGLSYTTFEYSALEIEPAIIGADGIAVIRCVVKNIGDRAGDEVVQLYIRDVLASLARPVLELKGFARVSLDPGEEATVTFTLGREQLQMLDRDMNWIVEPGVFRVMIGSSSKEIRLRGELVVQ